MNDDRTKDTPIHAELLRSHTHVNCSKNDPVQVFPERILKVIMD